jgi:hypothetical protein
LAIGRLAPSREDGVLIVGSSLSVHDMRPMMRLDGALEVSRAFNAWLGEVCEGDPKKRGTSLARSSEAPRVHPDAANLGRKGGKIGGSAGVRVYPDPVPHRVPGPTPINEPRADDEIQLGEVAAEAQVWHPRAVCSSHARRMQTGLRVQPPGKPL